MTTSTVTTPPPAPASRIEELGRIILAYSAVTEKLQHSQDQLQKTVQHLQEELGEKNRQLERKNRLAALGEMAAGMAHEIRNPLGGIQLYASMLAKDVSDQPGSLELVRKISTGVKRLEWLVSQVLQFTREIKSQPVETDLAGVVAQTVDLVSHQFDRSGITCAIEGPEVMNVSVDGMLIGQALLNLLLNASEAMDGPGAIRVCYGPGVDGRRMNLSVRDSGPGVSAEVMDKIFNPFFTTKDSGTGLGLAIVHRIVESHDGTITVTNPPEGGACFEIRV